MPDYFSQVSIHLVITVEERASVITDSYEEELFRYMAGTINNLKSYSLAVGGYRNHVHLLFELHPTMSISEIVREVKRSSADWINSGHKIPAYFRWQKGYGAFSVSHSFRGEVIEYIRNQRLHHQQNRLSFRDEFKLFLDRAGIAYDPKYILGTPDDSSPT